MSEPIDQHDASASATAAVDVTADADDTRAARRLRRLDHLGWIGMVLLLGAYAAVSFDLVERTGLAYVGVNVVGAALVAVICAAKRAWPAFALEVAWIVLTVPALWSGA